MAFDASVLIGMAKMLQTVPSETTGGLPIKEEPFPSGLVLGLNAGQQYLPLTNGIIGSLALGAQVRIVPTKSEVKEVVRPQRSFGRSETACEVVQSCHLLAKTPQIKDTGL